MITSKTNEYIKHVKFLSQKKYRDEYNEFVVEGFKLVEEAINEKVSIKKIIICEEMTNKILKENIYSKVDNILYVDENVFKYISETETPQGILAVIEKLETYLPCDDTIFALDNLQDPGNLGTIIRSLDCAGIKSLILSDGCADLYNSKVVRSTMGAIFRVNIYQSDEIINKIIDLKSNGYDIIVTSLQTNKYIYDLNLKQKCVIIIGNESKGVSNEIIELATTKVKIPMLGRTESLNAGVAASIMAYEVVRQKTKFE